MKDRSKLSAGIIFSLTLSLLLSAAMKATTAYAQQKAQIFVQLGHTDQVRSVAFSPDGRYLASVGQEAGVKLWEVASGREITTIAGKASGYFSVVFSADGKYLLAGGGEGVLELFDVAAAKSIRSFNHRYFGGPVCWLSAASLSRATAGYWSRAAGTRALDSGT